MSADSVRVLSITPSVVRWQDSNELQDLEEYFDPDIIFVVHEPDSELSFSDISSVFDADCVYPAKENKPIRHIPINGIDVVSIDQADTLNIVKEVEDKGFLDNGEYAYLLTTDLDISLDTTSLEASLVNEEQYYTHNSETDTNYIYLSASLPCFYYQRWQEMTVHGGKPKESDGGLLIPCFTLREDGRVSIETLRSSQLGLKALPPVGRKTKEKLNENGFETRKDIAQAGRGKFTGIYGIGQKTANKLWYHSRALVNGEVKRKENRAVPGDAPVFVDIKTDGVSPSLVWYIGAYDSLSNSYESFIAQSRDDREEVIKGFITWYAAECEDQTIMSWKGWEGNYHHMSRFIEEDAPQYSGIWERATKRDFYFWCSEQDRVALPGRTEKILDIATELGYDVDKTGLTQKQIRREYRNWMTDNVRPNWKLCELHARSRIEALVRLYDEVSLNRNVHGGAKTSN